MVDAEACSKCRTREEDWLDDEGFMHDPPLFEPVVDSCPGCAELARLRIAVASQARLAAGTGMGAQDAMDRMLAGISIGVQPFDPHRGIGMDREEDE